MQHVNAQKCLEYSPIVVLLAFMITYSTRGKAYKCLNTNTNKIEESINVEVDECLELNEVIQVHEPKDYKNFIYYYEGMPTEELEILAIEQASITV